MIGDEKIEVKGLGKMSKFESVMRKVYVLAGRGTPWAVQFIADRTEGKVADNINLIGKSKVIPVITMGVVEPVKSIAQSNEVIAEAEVIEPSHVER